MPSSGSIDEAIALKERIVPAWGDIAARYEKTGITEQERVRLFIISIFLF
jgi:hypothetical protein